MEIMQLVIAAISGGALTAVADFIIKSRTSKSQVKRGEFELLVRAMDELQDENTRLQKRLSEIEQENREYRHGITILLTQVANSGETPAWMPDGVELPKAIARRDIW